MSNNYLLNLIVYSLNLKKKIQQNFHTNSFILIHRNFFNINSILDLSFIFLFKGSD